jgi:hypothetical protein
LILFNGSAGGGASREADGWPLQYCPGALGGLKFIPVELTLGALQVARMRRR